MISLLREIWNTIKSFNPTVAALLFACSMLVSLFNWIKDMIAELMARLIELTLPVSAASMTIEGMSWFNYMFPLTELFAFGALAIAAYLVAAIIRIIKSFIPTVA